MEGLVLNKIFGDAYRGRNVLVTGHTGFKGSWLCLWLTTLGANVSGLALAPDTNPAHWSLLNLKSVRDLRIDLRNKADVEAALQQTQPEIIFHLAAQPLVRRSYREPLTTFDTNILGLVHLLEAVRRTPSVKVLINATTDKVYQEQFVPDGYSEDHPLGGHDPYSTSKACAELVTECYRKSFFTGKKPNSIPRVASARAGNVIGGGDWAEDRLIPDLVRAASAGETLQIRNPQATRPWQHVLEPLSGYLSLGQKLFVDNFAEGAWNFGPADDATLPVHALISKMHELWPGLSSEYHPEPHLHEAKILQLDCSKAAQKLAWRAVWNTDDTLQHTTQWYRAYYENSKLRSNEDIAEYVTAARVAGLGWAT